MLSGGFYDIMKLTRQGRCDESKKFVALRNRTRCFCNIFSESSFHGDKMKQSDSEKPNTDRKILELFFARDERALVLTAEKYGRLFRRIAYNITSDDMTSEEVVNDTYLALWSRIPPQKPESISAYGAGVARNIALERVRRSSAAKRSAAVEELDECLAGAEIPDGVDDGILTKLIEEFLLSEPKRVRIVFVMRYFEEEPLERISERTGMTLSAVKASLHRSRKRLRDHLEKEGYGI